METPPSSQTTHSPLTLEGLDAIGRELRRDQQLHPDPEEVAVIRKEFWDSTLGYTPNSQDLIQLAAMALRDWLYLQESQKT